MTLSAGQLTDLRVNFPHRKRFVLSALPLDPVFQAQVNDPSIPITGGGDLVVAYDNVSLDLGTHDHQTFILGSAPGLDDLGRGRVKHPPDGSTFTAAWNSDILWSDNAFITILYYFDIWPFFPRFTVSPEVFYKDYSIAYTDQNEVVKPVAICGPGAVKDFLEGPVVITLDATQSYTWNAATIDTYTWSFVPNSGITFPPVIDNASAARTFITFNQPGLHWLKLQIQDDASGINTVFRPFMIHDVDNRPTEIEELTRTQSWANGGADIQLRVNQRILDTEIANDTAVFVWSQNVVTDEGGDKDQDKNIDFTDDGNFPQYDDRRNIDFYGYVESLDLADWQPDGTGTVTIRANTPEHRLKNKYNYSITLIADPAVTGGVVDEWWKYPAGNLNIAQGAWHLLRWHCTHWRLHDVHLPDDDDRLRAGTEDFTEGSIFDRLTSFCGNRGIFAKPVSDIYGSLWIEIDFQAKDAVDRASDPINFDFQDTDWQGTVQIIQRLRKEASLAYVDGGNWDGITFTPLLSKWGSVAHMDGTNVIKASRVVSFGQADLNMITGRLVARANNPLREIRYTMAGNWSSAIGVVPQEWITLSVTGNEPGNKRGIVLNNTRTLPRVVQTQMKSNGVTTVGIVLEPEAFGRDGVDGDYPFAPATAGQDPDPPPPPSTPVITGSSVEFLGLNATTWQTRSVESTTWLEIVGGYANTASIPLLRGETGKIEYSANSGQTWNDVTPTILPPNRDADSPAPLPSTVDYRMFRRDQDNPVVVWCTARFNTGSQWRSWDLKSIDGGLTWVWATDWWLSGGFTQVDNWAAYQPVDAPDLATSYQNLNEPGTHDAIPSGFPPTHTPGVGWVFNGVDQYLETGKVPTSRLTSVWLAVTLEVDTGIRNFFGITAGTSAGKYLMVAENNNEFIETFVDGTLSHNLFLPINAPSYGTKKIIAIAPTDEFQPGFYRDAFDNVRGGTETGVGYDANGKDFYIGAANNGGFAVNWSDCKVHALNIMEGISFTSQQFDDMNITMLNLFGKDAI